MKNLRLVAVLGLITFTTALGARAATYRVTSLGDGPEQGTLRWALGKANADPGSTIELAVAGTITLSAPLPVISSRVTIDGTTAPGYQNAPVVVVDFANRPGLEFGKSANGSRLQALALVNAASDGITLRASRVTVAGNYIGLLPDGTAKANRGDGIRITSTSRANLIGNLDPVTGIRYFDTENAAAFTVQPVSAWQGLRKAAKGTKGFLICGTSNEDGLLYIGPLAGGGKSYLVQKPGASATSVYGPDTLDNGRIRLVGSYRTGQDSGTFNHGFVWEGRPSDLPSGGRFRTIDYPGATYQFTHSTMGDLAVGNADRPTEGGAPLGPGRAYIYNVRTGKFVTDIRFPNSKSNTAYGIWHNGGTSYTICGGYSPLPTNNLEDPERPLAQGRAFLVDYDSETGKFKHWASFRYRNGSPGRSFITHFEGISSAEKGVYTLNADSVKRGSSGPLQGSWVTVRRNADGSFGRARWVDLNYPGVRAGISSSNSVYDNHVVGLVIDDEPLAYQATVNLGFTLSNVIAGNSGNGIGIYGSRGNVIAQNFIGTNPAGTRAVPNRKNGILLTGRASKNVIGGQEAGDNNPTGSEGKTKPTFQRPAQGNLISGNRGNGVFIVNGANRNVLSGNFIGTNAGGSAALGNGGDGVRIERASRNTLQGCTLRQDPFVFYNVISGNRGNGVHLLSADDTTIRANFLGIGANNAVRVPNRGDGLLVAGSSSNTQVGGVIPLGNVISGNTGNGIAVTGTATGFISFNTFGGGFAFGGAAPNGRNGILITSTGGNNLIRTCILSGNVGNGLEIGGNASGVRIEDTACGTDTDISAALANGGSGVKISGTAHDNYLGGLQVSVETRTHFSGNARYGVEIVDQAYDNVIVNSNIGLGFALTDGLEPAIPNALGGVYLGPGTSGTTIGGTGPLDPNKISRNLGSGLTIAASTANSVVNNRIQNNTSYGVFATGACTGTALTDNTITGNATNIDIAGATGITVTP